MRKLLTQDGPKKIAGIIKDSTKYKEVEQLLTLLGQMQSMALSRFLTNSEILTFKLLMSEFFATYQV